MVRNALAALLVIASALTTAGCLERSEEIVIRPDGSADVTLTFRGNPGDFDELLTFPSDGWTVDKRVEQVKNDKGTSEEHVWTAKRTFANLGDYPDCFAAANVPHRDRLLHATTKLTVRTAGGRRVYEFERSWPQTVSGPTQRINDAFLEQPEMKAFLEKMQDGGLAKLSEKEAARFFELATAWEIEKQMELARRAVEAWGSLHNVGWEDRAALVAKIGAAYREAFTPAKAAEAVKKFLSLPEDAGLKYATELLMAPRKAAIAACEATDVARKFGGFGAAYESEDVAVRLGMSLNDDRFKLRVTFPGAVVAGNAKPEDGNDRVALWEFDGKDLQDHAVTLRAVAMEATK
ncbi:MAG: hypothetical protein IT452_05250 [Planctomycetia bacterium]|nr:hypothetical protein [Planctomycetia bacterium]